MNLIFICPRTNLNVQHRMDRQSPRDHEYEAVTCPACLRLHFVNCDTGKLLGHEAASADDGDAFGFLGGRAGGH